MDANKRPLISDDKSSSGEINEDKSSSGESPCGH